MPYTKFQPPPKRFWGDIAFFVNAYFKRVQKREFAQRTSVFASDVSGINCALKKGKRKNRERSELAHSRKGKILKREKIEKGKNLKKGKF